MTTVFDAQPETTADRKCYEIEKTTNINDNAQRWWGKSVGGGGEKEEHVRRRDCLGDRDGR